MADARLSARLGRLSGHLCPGATGTHVSETGGDGGRKRYRVAMLGCRARATAASRAYHCHPRCQIVGLCDLVPEVLNTLGDELGVPEHLRFEDLDEMMRTVKPDSA